MSDPRLVKMPFGTALRLLIRVEAARREGDCPDATDAQLADLVEAVMNKGEELVLGIDCTGDGIPEETSPAEIFLAVATGACDCRADIQGESDRQIQPEAPAAIQRKGDRW